ncbi:MAG: UDP-2,3-diacylglucosamine diphosphatase [Rhodospirillaceae bacterium]|nr:UDP-2,3-diacylglucosamine diphosphatase [Rhodospirillaceae bacterium]
MGYRTVWLSDIHLGSRGCRVNLLLDFLHNVQCERLYLVGDIVDLTRLRRSFYWPPSHTEVLRVILQKSASGTRVIYIPGNHDDDLRRFCGTRFGHIEIVRRAVHTTRSGRRLLIVHGDEFDSIIQCSPLLVSVGTAAYGMLLSINRLVHWTRQRLDRPYWSAARQVKSRMKHAVDYAERFKQACLLAAAEARVDGIVCGHIHRAELCTRDGLVYGNDGDWVESCTALVEHASGELALVAWNEVAAARGLSLETAA